MFGKGTPLYFKDRKLTLEEQLTENLQELQENPNAEMLPVTEGYLAFQKGGKALEEFLDKQKAKAEATAKTPD